MFFTPVNSEPVELCALGERLGHKFYVDGAVAYAAADGSLVVIADEMTGELSIPSVGEG